MRHAPDFPRCRTAAASACAARTAHAAPEPWDPEASRALGRATRPARGERLHAVHHGRLPRAGPLSQLRRTANRAAEGTAALGLLAIRKPLAAHPRRRPAGARGGVPLVRPTL